MAAYWGNADFAAVAEPYRKSMVTAAAMHDCGWREADEELWLREDGRLHDFTTYPLAERLLLYRTGVDMVEAKDAYAALLCSLHYAGFVQGIRGLSGDEAEQVRCYLAKEARRRRRLADRLSGSATLVDMFPDGRLDVWTMHHFTLLRLWDLLSLLLCMTRPGSSPDTWGPWFGQGEIRMPVEPGRHQPVHVRWEETGRLLLDPFPFSEPFCVHMPYRRLPPAALTKPQQRCRIPKEASRHILHVFLDRG